jgi:hypothetical protein
MILYTSAMSLSPQASVLSHKKSRIECYCFGASCNRCTTSRASSGVTLDIDGLMAAGTFYQKPLDAI